MDEYDFSVIIELACQHWYCTIYSQGKISKSLDYGTRVELTRFTEAFSIAWTSRNPFQCCDQVVTPDVLADLLPASFRAQYSSWLEERATLNPLYCYDRKCGVFLPPRLAEGPDAMRCNECRALTCRHCHGPFHAGRLCAADVDTQLVKVLAANKGWISCPSCSHIIEKQSGCVHMICRCGTQLCYRCGILYSVCPGVCSRTAQSF